MAEISIGDHGFASRWIQVNRHNTPFDKIEYKERQLPGALGPRHEKLRSGCKALQAFQSKAGMISKILFFSRLLLRIFRLTNINRMIAQKTPRQYEFPTGYSAYFGMERFQLGEHLFAHSSALQVSRPV